MKKIYVHAEHIRKQLNINKFVKYTIDNLYKDQNYTFSIDSNLYKSIIHNILIKIYNTCKIFKKNFVIDRVECIGGLSRLIYIRDIIESVYITVYKSINIEECIAKGACIYGANVTPLYKNININIQYKYNNTLYLVIDNKNAQKIISGGVYLPYKLRYPLIKKKILIQIYCNDIIIIEETIDLNQLYLFVIIELDCLPKFIVEYIKNKNLYNKTLEYKYNITSEKLMTIKKNEQHFLKKEYDNDNKKIILNKFEEYLFKIDNKINSKINKKVNKEHNSDEINSTNCDSELTNIIDNLKIWFEHNSSDAELQDCIKQFKLLKEIYETTIESED